MIDLDFFEKEEIEHKLQVAYRRGFVDGEEKGRAEAIEEFKQKIIEYSGEHYIDCDGYFGCNTELVFRVDEWLDDIVEQIKGQKNVKLQ